LTILESRQTFTIGGKMPGQMAESSSNTFRVGLAENPGDVAAAQRLRYTVFYEEGAARPDRQAVLTGMDADPFDAVCDHLLVFDCANDVLVGTYRLLRQEVAEAHDGFYTAREFDLTALLSRHRQLRFLELGRSCVLRPYRTRSVIELLWQGIWDYVRHHRIDVMLGCASLEGTDPDALALPLTFLAEEFAAPEAWRAAALRARHVEMRRLPARAIDRKAALKLLPPLIKGYLRLGCHVGEGAVIDHQFNTTDVLIVLPVASISNRYFARYGAPDGEPARHITV
jgi:putative hemolysin